MSGMHRAHFDHARLDLLSLIIWSRVFLVVKGFQKTVEVRDRKMSIPFIYYLVICFPGCGRGASLVRTEHQAAGLLESLCECDKETSRDEATGAAGHLTCRNRDYYASSCHQDSAIRSSSDQHKESSKTRSTGYHSVKRSNRCQLWLYLFICLLFKSGSLVIYRMMMWTAPNVWVFIAQLVGALQR